MYMRRIAENSYRSIQLLVRFTSLVFVSNADPAKNESSQAISKTSIWMGIDGLNVRLGSTNKVL
jgi:hypothetical protein